MRKVLRIMAVDDVDGDNNKRGFSAKLFAALLLAGPLGGLTTSAVTGLLIFVLQFVFNPGDMMNVGSLIGIGLAGVVVGAIVGWPSTLFALAPAHSFLLNRGMVKWWNYALTGLFTGSAICAISGLILLALTASPGFDDLISISIFLVLFAFTGALSAFFFWFIRRPDKDHSAQKIDMDVFS